MPITKINSLGVNLTSPTTFSAGTASLPSITFSGDTNTGVFAPAADTIGFAEGGAEAMRINSSGNVGIKTASPLRTLTVGGTSGELVLLGTGADAVTDALIGRISSQTRTFGANISTSSFGSIEFRTDPNTWYAGGQIVFLTGSGDATESAGTERMRINASGSLILAGSTAQKASGTTWSNPSDTRLKDNKQNYAKGLNELLQINVKTWEWNGKAGTTQGDVGIGVIADEIETILPNTIDTYKAKLNEDDTEQTDVKRFDATEITWLLLNSVKEQQAIIEQLKARLTALESK
jgi:hypothetical protein